MRSPVQSMLLALLAAPGAATAAAPRLDEAQWNALVREAVRHGVAPLVHARLERVGSGAGATGAVSAAGAAGVGSDAPESVRRILRAAYLKTALDNMRLFARVGDALRRLRAHGIAVIALKGAHLAHAVYGDPALRAMGDADLLVRRTDVALARQVLQTAGWDESAAAVAAFVPGGHQLPTLSLGGAHVELHWSIEDDDAPFAIDADGLWQRAQPANLGGAPARVLAAEDLLLHLALHAAYGHGWRQFDAGVRPLCDIAACLARFGDTLDWAALVERARAWRVHPCAWITLTLTERLLGIGAPAGVLAGLAPPGADLAMVEAAEALVLGSHYVELEERLPTLSRAWLTKRWHRLPRAGRWRAHAMPQAQVLASAYPSLRGAPLQPLRYAVHWAELLNEMARVSWARDGRALAAQEARRVRLVRWMEGQSAPARLRRAGAPCPGRAR